MPDSEGSWQEVGQFVTKCLTFYMAHLFFVLFVMLYSLLLCFSVGAKRLLFYSLLVMYLPRFLLVAFYNIVLCCLGLNLGL